MQTHHTLSHSHKHTHTYASLIYYSFLWPKSVTSCVTERSYTHIQQCIHRDTHTQHRYMYHVPFQQRGRVNGVFLYDGTTSLLIVPFWSWNHNVWMDVKLSSRRAPREPSQTLHGKEKPTLLDVQLNKYQQTSPEGFGVGGTPHSHQGLQSLSPYVPGGFFADVIVCGIGHMWSFRASLVLLIDSSGRRWGCSRWAWQQSTAFQGTGVAPIGEQLQGFRFTLEPVQHQVK